MSAARLTGCCISSCVTFRVLVVFWTFSLAALSKSQDKPKGPDIYSDLQENMSISLLILQMEQTL